MTALLAVTVVVAKKQQKGRRDDTTALTGVCKSCVKESRDTRAATHFMSRSSPQRIWHSKKCIARFVLQNSSTCLGLVFMNDS